MVDFDTAEHMNVALEPTHTQVLEQLTSVVHEYYAQDCVRITAHGTPIVPAQ